MFFGVYNQNMISKQDIEKLIEAQKPVFATKTDIVSMEGRINVNLVSLKEKMATKVDMIEQKSSFSDLQTSVDRYLKFTEAWHQELTILRNRQDRLTQVLIDKGVVSPQEVALLG